MAYIYKITNIKNETVYIGRTRFDPNRTWKEHKWALNRNKKSNMKIHQSMLLEGIENFRFEVVEECKESEMIEIEIYWIEKFKSNIHGYNDNIPREKNSLFNNLKKPK